MDLAQQITGIILVFVGAVLCVIGAFFWPVLIYGIPVLIIGILILVNVGREEKIEGIKKIKKSKS